MRSRFIASLERRVSDLVRLRGSALPIRLALRKIFGWSQVAGIRSHLEDAPRLKAAYEKEYATFFERRKVWLELHPEFASSSPVSIEALGPTPRAALVISPHPDDEVIGCGGTLLHLISKGTRVTILQLTDGAETKALEGVRPELGRMLRLKEAENVARFLGVKDLRLWALPDGQFEVTPEVIERLRQLLDEVQPDWIFLPFINDLHPDHVKSNRLLARALEVASHTTSRVLSYETWAVVPATHYCVTTQFFEKKAEALALYPIPMKVVDYIRFCARREAYHHWEMFGGVGFAEAFFVVDPKQFLEIIRGEAGLT